MADYRIPLGITPVQAPDPVRGAQQALTLRALMGEDKLRQMQTQRLERQFAEEDEWDRMIDQLPDPQLRMAAKANKKEFAEGIMAKLGYGTQKEYPSAEDANGVRRYTAGPMVGQPVKGFETPKPDEKTEWERNAKKVHAVAQKLRAMQRGIPTEITENEILEAQSIYEKLTSPTVNPATGAVFQPNYPSLNIQALIPDAMRTQIFGGGARPAAPAVEQPAAGGAQRSPYDPTPYAAPGGRGTVTPGTAPTTKLNEDVEKFSKVWVDKKVPVLDELAGNIDNILETYPQGKLPGIGYGMTGSDIVGATYGARSAKGDKYAQEAQRVRNGIKAWTNNIVRASAGLSQTITELANVLAETATSPSFSEADFRNAYARWRDAYVKERAAILGAAPPEVVNEYGKRQGRDIRSFGGGKKEEKPVAEERSVSKSGKPIVKRNGRWEYE